jgi:hypothetical protein
MKQKPAIRYTKGPEELTLGPVSLVRADLDKEKAGWRETTNELALEAIRPGRVEEYGFEARDYVAPAADADAGSDASAPASTGKRARSTNQGE